MFRPAAALTANTGPEECRRILDHLAEDEAGTGLVARMGIEFTGLAPDSMTATVPVEGNTQPMGLFHGGAHVVLAESLASMHSYLLAGGRNVVGVDLNATHLRAVREGLVTGTASVLHQGRTIMSHEVRMTDEAGRLLSIVRITNMVLASKPR